MGNIINFMEKLGASAEFQELSEAEVIEMLNKADKNIADTFLPHVEKVLDVRKNLVCGILPAEEPQDEPQDAPEEETPESAE